MIPLNNIINKNASIKYFPQLDSTNLYAKQTEAASDTIIITDNQTKGKGRFNREWVSEPGKNISFTIVKELDIPSEEIHIMNYYTSLIVCSTLKKLFPAIRFSIKWPNDILADGKKISGVLSEVINLSNPKKKFIIGIGINANQENFPAEIQHKAASLKAILYKDVDNAAIIQKLITDFYSNLDLLSDKITLFEEWKSLSCINGKMLEIKTSDDSSSLQGKFINISNSGGLILEVNGKQETFFSGEISLEGEYK